MKKENCEIIENTIPHRYMTDAEKAQSALLSEKSFFKEKYRHALKMTTKMKIEEYAQIHPEWTIKDVLIAIITGYNSQLPSQVILEMIQFIVIEWEKILTTKNELVYS